MKKKELISKIDSLINSLNEMNAELKACRQENSELKLQIEELKATKNEPKTEPIVESMKEPIEEVQPENAVEEPLIETKMEEESKTVEKAETERVEEPTEKKVLNILPMGEEVILPDSIMEFGAEIIGKIVIESAKYADLVAASTTANKKELLNLIMGKSEMCKAEILNVVTSNAFTETKISRINAELSEAVDYFKSVVAQI